MQNILIIINDLSIGGSEKSLLSLLHQINYKKYQVDLQMVAVNSRLEKYLPKEVNILPIPQYYQYLNGNYKNIKFLYTKIKISVQLRIFRMKKKHTQQIIYKNQKNIIENNNKIYDKAIAYAQGFPTYYLVDKIIAKKKIAWINCDYMNSLYNKEFDYKYYKKINDIVVVSNTIKNSIKNIKKEYKDKIKVILDIVNPILIEKMSLEVDKQIYNNNIINILTVGRIAEEKGHDKIIFVSKILKKNGFKFKWHLVGDGPNRKMIKKLIEKNNLKEEIILWGAQENPYPYMKQCDLYVQPSVKEGFGLTVVEAKILKKFIICTNFTTAKELIKNEVDGLIVGLEPIDIYKGIKRFLEDNILRNNIRRNLNLANQYNSLNEIKKIEKILEE